MSIAANLERIRNELHDTCARVGRPAESVALMAVSKTQPAEALLEAYAAGQTLFGENRVQEFAAKQPALPAAISVHLIGPLQSNKTAPAASLFQAVDTIDSLKTATRLNAAASSLHKVLPILIEIKLSHEESKHGLAPEELPAFLAELGALTSLQPRGLMTVPPFSDDPKEARPYFQQLRRLRDAHPTLTELSMGMSHDFAVAIEEGATTVRIGTAIFGTRG